MESTAGVPLMAWLMAFVVQLPLFGVWLAGGIVAVLRRGRHPEVSRLMLIALGVLLVSGIANTYANLYLPFFVRDLGLGVAQWVIFVKGVIHTAITAIAWGLVLWAALGWRRPAASEA
ncbi:MAG: hypothetical protein HY689_13470 [Chloroflexi bacterium]|nr:hypothetical protein [Chloroflexota bacterium]